MKKIVWLILLFFLVNTNYSQINVSNEFNTIFNSDLTNYNPFLNSVKVSLYNPILTLSDADNSDSPSLDYYFGDFKKELFPFGSNSIDYLPVSILSISELKLKNENIKSPFGVIKISKTKFSKAPRLNVHLFLGGETGDPMHHNYTRGKFVNRNKIQPSGEFVFSNSLENFSYRFFGGFNGYFTQQDQNTNISKLINEDEFSDPNKKINLGTDLLIQINNRDKIDLSAGLTYNSAFEFSSALPFISFATHKNYYLYTSYYNLYSGIKITLKAENIESEISESPFWSLVEFSEKIFLLKGEKEFLLDKLKVNLFGEIGKRKLTNNKDVFFTEEYDGNKYHAGFESNYQLGENVSILLGGNYKNDFLEDALNFSTGIQYKNENSSYKISFKKLDKIPGSYDRFQNFAILSNNSRVDFLGNSKLKNEKLQKLEFVYNYLSEKVKIYFEPSFSKSENRIIWKNEAGNVWRKTNSLNVDYFNLLGNVDISINKSFSLIGSYKFNSNSEELQVPAHRMKAGLIFKFDINARFSIESVYRSEIKNWNLTPDYGYWFNFGNDFNYQIETPDFFIVNLSWDQNLPEIMGLKNIRFAVRCENIFDKYVRYHPSSCEFPRNFTFNLFFAL